MIGPYRIEGFAIALGRRHDRRRDRRHAARAPARRRQGLFRGGAGGVAAVVHGRHSQEIQPKTALRRRLIATRSVAGVAPDPENPLARLWNPAGASLEDRARGARRQGRDGRRHRRAAGLQRCSSSSATTPSISAARPTSGCPAACGCSRAKRFDGEPDACLRAAGLRPGDADPARRRRDADGLDAGLRPPAAISDSVLRLFKSLRRHFRFARSPSNRSRRTPDRMPKV